MLQRIVCDKIAESRYSSLVETKNTLTTLPCPYLVTGASDGLFKLFILVGWRLSFFVCCLVYLFFRFRFSVVMFDVPGIYISSQYDVSVESLFLLHHSAKS